MYDLVVQNDYDFRREAVQNEIEGHAAFNFVENACVEIPRPNATQLQLFVGEGDAVRGAHPVAIVAARN